LLAERLDPGLSGSVEHDQPVLQIHFNDAQERLTQLPQAETEGILQEYEAFFRRPEVKDGNQLQLPATATTVRVHEGELVRSDGPFP
jgi:hypothetical protein